MAITTQAGLLTAMSGGQKIVMDKANAATTAGGWITVFTGTGAVGAGVLAGTSTAAGVVPTDATAGFPTIYDIGAGNTGYLGSIEFLNTVSGRQRLCDMVFKAGAYAFNAAVTLAAQPSYAGRMPGTDYKGAEIWFEAVTAFTGSPSLAVTYTNQDGTAARTTGVIALGAQTVIGRLVQMPLQSGDTGVQKIESVTATVATVGTFNVLVLRPLWQGYVLTSSVVNNLDMVHGPDKTGLPIIFGDSALITTLYPGSGSTNTGVLGHLITVIQG